MSGIYLVVWDTYLKDLSFVLQPTKGGWPHITVAYTGDKYGRIELLFLAQMALDEFALDDVRLTEAYVNSFEDKPGHMRHDVLVPVAPEDAARVEKFRERFDSKKSYFGKPHVTYQICETRSEAERVRDKVNQYLPRVVCITGVTID